MELHNKRMFLLADHMANNGILKKDFYTSIGFYPYNADRVRKGTLSFTVENIANCIKIHGINPAYFFKKDAPMFE